MFKQGWKYIDNEPLPALLLENFSSNDNDRKPDTKKVKYILYLYAHLYDDFSSDIQSHRLEVEHILPKTWQNMNFDGWNETSHSQYLEQNRTGFKKFYKWIEYISF